MSPTCLPLHYLTQLLRQVEILRPRAPHREVSMVPNVDDDDRDRTDHEPRSAEAKWILDRHPCA